eukprot:PRCOL_00002809-RA
MAFSHAFQMHAKVPSLRSPSALPGRLCVLGRGRLAPQRSRARPGHGTPATSPAGGRPPPLRRRTARDPVARARLRPRGGARGAAMVKRVGIGTTAKHARSMLRSMVDDLVRHERIETTVPRAKDLRKLADKVISMGKVRRRRGRGNACVRGGRACLRRNAAAACVRAGTSFAGERRSARM